MEPENGPKMKTEDLNTLCMYMYIYTHTYIHFKKMLITVVTEHTKFLQKVAKNICLGLLVIKEPSAVNWTDKW